MRSTTKTCVLSLVLLASAGAASALPWPLDNGAGPYGIGGTLGEYRSTGNDHFHDGVDISTTGLANVRAMQAGTVAAAVSNDQNSFVSITVGWISYIYFHVNPAVGITAGVPVSLGQPIGTVYTAFDWDDHIHLEQMFLAQDVNTLLSPGFSNYVDTSSPSVSTVQFFDANTAVGGSAIDISSPVAHNYLRVRAREFDRQSLGSKNVAVYSTGYKVFNAATNALVLDRSVQQSYGSFPLLQATSPQIAYDTTTSNTSTYYYFANNQVTVTQPLDLRSQPDGTYNICVVAKDIKGNGGNISTQQGAECKTYRLDRAAPATGLRDANGTEVFSGGASSMTSITVTSTDTFGLAQIALTGAAPRSVTGYTATETFTGLADGQHTASVTDLAGNVNASVAFTISSSTPNAATEDDKGGVITDVIPSSRCIVIKDSATLAGISSIQISGTGLSKTINYSCTAAAKSTETYTGAFCNLVENSTYTYTVTSCSGMQTTSPEITIATSTKGGRICVTSPAGNFCGGTGALNDTQLRTYGTNMRVCLYTGSCGLCSITGYDNVTAVPVGSTYCGNTCCRVISWPPPLGNKTFSVSNTTDVSNGDSGTYEFSITTTGSEGQVSIATLNSPNFKMDPGEGTSGTIDVAQIGQGYPTDSSDGIAHINSPFTRLHFSLRDLLEFLLPLARQLLRASTPYVYNYLGSDAIFNSTTTLTLSYVDAVNTDTTTVRIYMFDGVSWSSSGITNQSVSYSTTTQTISASGSVDRTGLYAALYQGQDSSAPITTFSVQGSTFNFDGALFVSTDSYAVLTATDPAVNGFASTVASVTYRIDPSSGSSFYIYSSSIPLSLGTHVFEYRSLDYAGNTETVKTATFTVTAGTALRTTNTAHVPGTLLTGFLGSGAKLEVESQAQNTLTLLISSVNRQGMVSVDNIGEVGIGVTPQANLNIGQSSIALQLRSGNSTSAVTSNQIALGYNGDYSMRHLLRTEHSTAAHGNKLDFLVWNTGAGSTTTLASLNVLSLQGIASAGGGSFHVQPVGEPDAEVEVSNGLSTGGGTMQRLQVVSPSSRRFKTDIKDLSVKDEERALADVAALKHARFRYKSRGKDGRLAEDPARTLHTGLIYEEAPESIREGGEALSTSERLVNVELALKAEMRLLEELQKRYEKLKARRKTP